MIETILSSWFILLFYVFKYVKYNTVLCAKIVLLQIRDHIQISLAILSEFKRIN